MTAAECRAQAQTMRRQAERSKDPVVREQMLLMAADWEKLAQQAEALQRQTDAGQGS